MISFSDQELADLPVATIGQETDCPNCGGRHVLKGGLDKNGKETAQLLFYKCGETPYFGGFLGRLIPSLVAHQES